MSLLVLLLPFTQVNWQEMYIFIKMNMKVNVLKEEKVLF